MSSITVFETLHKKWSFPLRICFSKCDQFRRKLQIWTHLLKQSLMTFCALTNFSMTTHFRYYTLIVLLLTHFRPMFHICTSWNELIIYRSSHSQMFFKKGVLKNLAYNFIKKRLQPKLASYVSLTQWKQEKITSFSIFFNLFLDSFLSWKQNISNWTRWLKLQLQIWLVSQCLRSLYENVFFCDKALYQTFYFGKVHCKGVCF